MNGFVILDKAQGISSFGASSFLRKIYDEKKTGHTGTLDPMATGVLPVAVGRATRFIEFLPDREKSYTAALLLGTVTDTLDITGKILKRSDVTATSGDLQAALADFRGDIKQTPPMYSAVSVNGERLYKLARKGMEVERGERTVHIKELELTKEFGGNEYEIKVTCSKGTYIRSLISDIGETLGCGAVMTALRRTASNGFFIENAATEEELKKDPEKYLLPVDRPFSCFPQITVTPKQAVRFSNGGDLFTERLKVSPEPSLYRVYSEENEFLGLGEICAQDTSSLRVRRVMQA